MSDTYIFQCQECEKGFSPQRCSAKFCSTRCRSRANMRTKRYEKKIAPLQKVIASLQNDLDQQLAYRKQVSHQFEGLQQQKKTFEASITTDENQRKELKRKVEQPIPVDSSTLTAAGIQQYVMEFGQAIDVVWEINELKKKILADQIKLQEVEKQQQKQQYQLQVIDSKIASLHLQIRDRQAALEKINKPRKRRLSSAAGSTALEATTQQFEGAADFAARKFNTLTLPGPLGAFLGSLDRHKTAFALTGDPGAGKSHLCCAMAKVFSEHGLKVAFYQIEMGTKKIFADMVKHYNLSNSVKVSEEATLEDITRAASIFDCIIIDSFTKVSEEQGAFDQLVKQCPTTIFVAIFQKTASGSIRGGSRINFDSSAVIDVTFEDGQRIAYMEKSRYGTIGWKYDMIREEVI